MKNPFAENSLAYANSRPHYPSALFEWLAKESLRHDVAWDTATGNGQAAFDLANHFKTVYATDISAEQLAHAKRRENIEYRVARAEESGLREHSVDLIVAAQALHWLDLSKFWKEVSRVARRDALFCAWGYHDMRSSVPELDHKLIEPFMAIVDPFWRPENKLLWRGYRSEEIGFPYPRIKTPKFSIEVEWTVEQLLTYLKTWSAFKFSRADAKAVAAMDLLLAQSEELAAPEQLLRISMPLEIVVGRVEL